MGNNAVQNKEINLRGDSTQIVYLLKLFDFLMLTKIYHEIDIYEVNRD